MDIWRWVNRAKRDLERSGHDRLAQLIDDLLDGLDIGLDFATGLERFVGPLTELLGRVQNANR